MKEAFSSKNGFKLIFNAADNKPENQIAAVHSFINQGVDAIVIAAVVTTGWDDVLKEAKDAKIPVILEDRTIDADPSLYASWIGDDFKKEGETAGSLGGQGGRKHADEHGRARRDDRARLRRSTARRASRRASAGPRSPRSIRRRATSPVLTARP